MVSRSVGRILRFQVSLAAALAKRTAEEIRTKTGTNSTPAPPSLSTSLSFSPFLPQSEYINKEYVYVTNVNL